MEEKKTITIEVTDEVDAPGGEPALAKLSLGHEEPAESMVETGDSELEPVADELTMVEAEPSPETLVAKEEPTPVLATSQMSVPAPTEVTPPNFVSKLLHNKWLIGVLVFVVLSIGAIVTILLMKTNAPSATHTSDDSVATPSPASARKLGLTVTLVDGTATIAAASGTSQPLATSSQLNEGDSILTNANSRVVLTFDDGSALRLDQQTKVTLVSLNAHAVRIAQESGTAYSRVVKSDRSYAVTVDDTTYTAQGTAFATTGSQNKGVQVYESAVKVSGLADAVAEGNQYYKVHHDKTYSDKVTAIDLALLDKDSFAKWNLAEDEKSALFKDKLGIFKQLREHAAKEQQKTKEATNKPEQSNSEAGLVLAARAVTGGAELTWTATNVTAPYGFKLVRSSTSPTPTFGKDEAFYIEDASARTANWKSDKDGTYWYRICIYQKEAGCNRYSNAVQLSITGSKPKDDTSAKPVAKVERGTLTLHSVSSTGKAHWTFTGKAPYGYKLVISSQSNPSYPGSQATYISDSDATYGYVPNVKKPGIYYVRVCAFTNGSEADACVNYSNQLTYTKL